MTDRMDLEAAEGAAHDEAEFDEDLEPWEEVLAEWEYLGWLDVLPACLMAITGAFASAVDEGVNGSGETRAVVYSIESDAPTVSATYSTIDGGNIGQSQDTAATPPWTAEIEASDATFSSYTLTASMNPVLDGSAPDGTTITCRITVDGEVVAEQTSSGQYATATCNAS